MTNIAEACEVYAGVDTHADTHHAAVIDQNGKHLADAQFPTTPAGYAALTTVFPLMVSAFHPGTVFLFFAFMMFLHLLWAVFLVPETKGVALEEIQRRLGLLDA